MNVPPITEVVNIFAVTLLGRTIARVSKASYYTRTTMIAKKEDVRYSRKIVHTSLTIYLYYIYYSD